MSRSFFTDTLCPLLASKDPLPAIDWMKQHRLLASSNKCESCNELMNWTKWSQNSDGYAWRCLTKACPKFSSRKSIRSNSMFEKSNLPLAKWILAIYLWSQRASQKIAMNQMNVSNRTIHLIYKKFRQICLKYFIDNPVKLGGPSKILQLDESSFSGKSKHHRGRTPSQPAWVFGMVEAGTNIGYMEIVERRNAETLLPIIEKIALPGTTIHSDQWKAYSRISDDLGQAYETVNHSIWFVDKTKTKQTFTHKPSRVTWGRKNFS